MPEVVWQKAEYIRQAGNGAVHGNKAPAPEQALNVVRELYHVLYWTGRAAPTCVRARRACGAIPSTNLSSRKWNRVPRRPASRIWMS